MKKIAFCLWACLLVITVHAQEEDFIPLPNKIIKMNPWEFIDNTFFLEIEKFNPDQDESWNFGFGFKTGYDWYGDEEIGGKLELSKRFYLKGMEVHYPKKDRNPHVLGVFVGFFARGVFTYKGQEDFIWNETTQESVRQTNERTVISAFPGVQLGVARTFWDILYIEGYIGGGVRYAFYEDSNPNFQQDDPYYSNYYDVSDAEYRGVAPNIGMKVGVAF